MKTLIIATLLLGSSLLGPAPGAESLSARSNLRARRVVESAIAALGGAEAMRAARTFTIREAGTQYQLFQSASPDPPFTPWGLEQTIVVDLPGNRATGDGRLRSSTSPYEWWTRTIVTPNGGYDVNIRLRTAIALEHPSIADYPAWTRRLPHNLLAESLERSSSLRWIGTDVDRGAACDVVSFAPASGPQLAVFVDSATHLVTRFEYLYTANVAGDTSHVTLYKPYREAGGTRVPSGRTILNAGHLAQDTDYVEVRLDDRLAEAGFALPDGVVVQKAVDDEQPRVTELARDVYLAEGIPGGYNVLFVAFDEYVLVAEAPEGNTRSGLSERVIAMIKERVPGKPIRYVVLTHHHGDHASGARAYMAEGATVVTTPGNRAFVERLASVSYAHSPDSLARAPRPPAIQMIENRELVFSDRDHRVELYDIGPLDHAREMVVVYLPREQILYQSDLFNPVGRDSASVGREAFYHGIAEESTEALRRFVAKRGLRVRTLAGSHGRIATWGEVVTTSR
jgi:glyoxylase-like metal-dependent hydrolase (beta-lactamase superfamily II)